MGERGREVGEKVEGSGVRGREVGSAYPTVHPLIISLWQISVALATKPRSRPQNFSLFGIVLIQATFVPN